MHRLSPVGFALIAAAAAITSLLLDLRSRTVDISAVPAWRALLALMVAWAAAGVASLPLPAGGRSRQAGHVALGAFALLTVALGLRWAAGADATPTRLSIPATFAGAVLAVVAAAWTVRDVPKRSVLPALLEAWTATFAAAVAARGLMGEPSSVLQVRTEDLQALGACLLAGTVGLLVLAVQRRSRPAVAAAGVGVAAVAAANAAWWNDGAPRWGWSAVALGLGALRLGVLGLLAAGARSLGRGLARTGRRAGRALRGPARRAARLVAAVIAPAGADGTVPGPVRFRGGERWWAWILGGLACLTVLADVLWAYRVGYQPIGHGASIPTQGWDITLHHHPLVGMPTSFADYQNGVETFHPGPLLFDFFSPWVRTLGLRDGAIIGSAVLNLVCWLLGAWAGFRAGGRTAGVAAWIAGAVVINVVQRDAPFEAASAIMLFLSVLTVPLLCWAAATGTRKALPIAVAVMSLNTQGYLAHGMVTALPVLWAGAVVAIEAVRGPGQRAARKTLLVSGALLLFLWSLPIYDAVTNGGGNVRALWLATQAGTSTIGPKGFYLAVAWTLQIPFPWARLQQPFAPDYRAYLGGMSIVGPLLLVAVVALAVVQRRRANAGLRRLWFAGAVVLLATSLSLTQFPVGFTAFYQLAWMASAAAFLWIVAAVTVWQLLLAPWLARRPAPARHLRTATLAVAALAVLLTGLHTPARLASLKGRYAYIDLSVPAMVDAADEAAEGKGPMLVISMDAADQQTMSDVVTAHLITLGHQVYVEPGAGGFFGKQHIVPDHWSGPALLVVDGSTPTRPPGKILARSEPKGWSQDRFDRVAKEVADWARAHGPIVPNTVIKEELVAYLDPWMPDASCEQLRRLADGTDPLSDAPDGVIARLLADDVLLSPQLPPALRTKLDQAGETPFELWETDFPADDSATTSTMRRDLTQCDP